MNKYNYLTPPLVSHWCPIVQMPHLIVSASELFNETMKSLLLMNMSTSSSKSFFKKSLLPTCLSFVHTYAVFVICIWPNFHFLKWSLSVSMYLIVLVTLLIKHTGDFLDFLDLHYTFLVHIMLTCFFTSFLPISSFLKYCLFWNEMWLKGISMAVFNSFVGFFLSLLFIFISHMI